MLITFSGQQALVVPQQVFDCIDVRIQPGELLRRQSILIRLLEHIRKIRTDATELVHLIIVLVELHEEASVLGDVDTVLVNLYLLAQIIRPLVTSVHEQFDIVSSWRPLEFRLLCYMESDVIAQHRPVVRIGQQHPPLVLRKSPERCFLVELESVRLLVLQPGRIPSAANAERMLGDEVSVLVIEN